EAALDGVRLGEDQRLLDGHAAEETTSGLPRSKSSKRHISTLHRSKLAGCGEPSARDTTPAEPCRTQGSLPRSSPDAPARRGRTPRRPPCLSRSRAAFRPAPRSARLSA